MFWGSKPRKGILSRCKEKYRPYYPFSEIIVQQKAVRYLTICVILWLVGSICLLFYSGGMMGYLLMVLWGMVTARTVWNMEENHEKRSRQKRFLDAVSTIRHQYYREQNVEEAIRIASLTLERQQNGELTAICRVLNAVDKIGEERRYLEKVKDWYFRFLMLQASAIDEHGDNTVPEQHSVFQENLTHLRKMAEENARREQRMRYLLSGLGLVIIIPVYALPAIRSWAVGSLPELDAFYSGWAGNAMQMGIFLLTVALYQLFQELKGKKYNPALLSFVRWLKMQKIGKRLLSLYQKNSSKDDLTELLKRVNDKRTAEDFFLYRILIAFLAMGIPVVMYFLFSSYQDYNILVCLFASVIVPVIGYWYPVWRLLLEGLLTDNLRREEIMQFQMLLILERNLPGITNYDLLMQMYEQANLFRTSLMICVSEFEQNENEAFYGLWQREKDPAFRKIVDMFLMTEENSIPEAFDELKDDMDEMEQNERLESEIWQQGRSEAAMLLACIPGILALFGYLIIPFMSECFRMLDYYNSAIGVL